MPSRARTGARKTVPISLRFAETLTQAIDRHASQLGTDIGRSEAIRDLVERGLERHGEPRARDIDRRMAPAAPLSAALAVPLRNGLANLNQAVAHLNGRSMEFVQQADVEALHVAVLETRKALLALRATLQALDERS